MYRVMYNTNAHYVSCRAGVYHYTRHVPIDVRQYYASPRLSFSLEPNHMLALFVQPSQ